MHWYCAWTRKVSAKALEGARSRCCRWGLGYVEGITHDYKRHGTTTLFAALDYAQRHGARRLQAAPPPSGVPRLRCAASEANVPEKLDIHLIVDNYSTHKHAKVKAWLAKRPHWHIHFIHDPIALWLNMVERFFALITEKAIRRGSFSSVKDLVNKIDRFVSRVQQNLHTFPLDTPPLRFQILATNSDRLLHPRNQWDRTLGDRYKIGPRLRILESASLKFLL